MRMQKNQSTNAVMATATSGPTTTPAIHALFSELGDCVWVGEAADAVAVPDDCVETGTAAVGSEPDAVLDCVVEDEVVDVAEELVELVMVTTESAASVSIGIQRRFGIILHVVDTTMLR